jgi:erythromycin esterase-like protein
LCFFAAAPVVLACRAEALRTRSPTITQGEVVRELIDGLGGQSVHVVAFGESTHGTYEFASTAFEYALALAATGESVTLALERPPLAGLLMNEWAHGCGNLGSTPEEPPPVTAAEAAFLEQARRHHAAGGSCIRIVGVDAPVPRDILKMLWPYGKQCLGATWDATTDKLALELGAEPLDTSESRARAKNMLAEFRNRAMGGPTPIDGCADLEWWAYLASRTLEIRETENLDRTEDALDVSRHETDRDALMSDGVLFWASRQPHVVFFAHALHIVEVPQVAVRGGGVRLPSGYHLQKSLGAGYVSVGLIAGQGGLNAIGCVIEGGGSTRQIPPPRRASLQRDLLRDYEKPVVLRSQTACDGRECGVLRVFVYCLPRGWRDPKVSYSVVDVEDGFDWLVFWPQSTPNRFER